MDIHSHVGSHETEQVTASAEVLDGIGEISDRLSPTRSFKVDIKDAYLHVQILFPSPKDLWFAMEDHRFQFVALPFGLFTALKVFPKVLALVLGLLQNQSVQGVMCIVPPVRTPLTL